MSRLRVSQTKTGYRSRYPEPEVPEPDDFMIDEWVMDSVCECTGLCACTIEPDGVCKNGFPSWLLWLELV
jgi:hypothetical protein